MKAPLSDSASEDPVVVLPHGFVPQLFLPPKAHRETQKGARAGILHVASSGIMKGQKSARLRHAGGPYRDDHRFAEVQAQPRASRKIVVYSDDSSKVLRGRREGHADIVRESSRGGALGGGVIQCPKKHVDGENTEEW